jgi:uncharacterized membrane-anchored protein
MYKKIAITSLFLILAVVNWSIVGKEKHLAEGKIVYLELAPVDPRSLMQGDYMALNFELANAVYTALPKTEEDRRWGHDVAASDGFVVTSLNEQNVGQFKNLYNGQTLSKNELLLHYRVRDGAVKFATNAYFFQEGLGDLYAQARYGQFRVDNNGELLLVALYDNHLKLLVPEKQK